VTATPGSQGVNGGGWAEQSGGEVGVAEIAGVGAAAEIASAGWGESDAEAEHGCGCLH
jgi:hypothetical protein